VALSYYLDTHIAKAVAEQLRASGVDVIRCEEVGMADASDEDHLQYATQRNLILVSQDDDFIMLAERWHQVDRSHAGIMKVSHSYRGANQISFIVQQLLFYTEAEQAGAVDYRSEIANQVIYL
jgi:hypothetical protein